MKNLFFIAAVLLSMAFVITACSDNKSKAKAEQLDKGEMVSCKMHNEVMSVHEGECPRCGMRLVKQKMTAEQQKIMREVTSLKPKQ